MIDEPLPNSEIILYQTEDGRTRIQCRFENETVWLTQKLMAELFGKDVRTINEHIQNVFAEGELVEDSVMRKFRIAATDGESYQTRHYNLEVIIGDEPQGQFAESAKQEAAIRANLKGLAHAL